MKQQLVVEPRISRCLLKKNGICENDQVPENRSKPDNSECFDTHGVVGALHTFGVEQQHAVNHVLSTCFVKETASVSMTNFRVSTETPDMFESVDTHGVVGAVTVARPSLKTRRLKPIPYSWWSPSWRSPVSSSPSITVDGRGGCRDEALSHSNFPTSQFHCFPDFLSVGSCWGIKLSPEGRPISWTSHGQLSGH